jgi:hypothetical protein
MTGTYLRQRAREVIVVVPILNAAARVLREWQGWKYPRELVALQVPGKG